jgi:hypothetical protein
MFSRIQLSIVLFSLAADVVTVLGATSSAGLLQDDRRHVKLASIHKMGFCHTDTLADTLIIGYDII